ncbi:MAG: GTP-binding protein [Candidatus Thorarchaeota archaeon]|nr:MAG: GTP-binding protein [Candidatus Thorarchaeota archaeon]
MIHNTLLIRISTRKIIASSQYWPVDVAKEVLNEFISTREELRSEHDEISELPLIIGDHKFLGKDWIEDSVLVFVTDKGEDESNVYEKMDQALKALKKTFKKKGIEGVVENYEKLIEPSVTTRLKIALVGEGGVGKTTTLHLLLGETPPLQYVPTIALNLETVENIRFGNYSLVLWDFAGQERFRTLWRFYFHGADVIFLVSDSTLRNVIISKDILKLIKRDAPKVPVFALANKQDKPTAMKPEVVQKILGIPTYPMVAIDIARRDEMLRILMTAASQYVGVALPDLPASELLKFTEAATEGVLAESEEDKEAAEEEVEEEDEEYETVVEEVYVDEDGRVLEDIDEYEIIEEEEVEEVEVAETAEEVEVAETGDEEEVPIEEAPTEHEPVEVEADEEFEVPTIDEDEEEEIEVESPEPEVLAPESSTTDEGPEIVVEEDAEAMQMAKDIIFEALEADDIIVAEIDQVSAEEIDTALEAIGSDEAIPIDNETEDAEKIDEESLMELETILGPLERSVGGMSVVETDDDDDENDSHLPINGETLAELDRLLDSSEDEEKDD